MTSRTAFSAATRFMPVMKGTPLTYGQVRPSGATVVAISRSAPSSQYVLGLGDGALHDLVLVGVTVGVEHGGDLLGNERGSSSASTASQNDLLHR